MQVDVKDTLPGPFIAVHHQSVAVRDDAFLSCDFLGNQEEMANTNPTSPPTIGPARIPAMMAGKCRLVAASVGLGTGIRPKGVKASTMASAPNTPATARS